jgi:hypothetical protein
MISILISNHHRRCHTINRGSIISKINPKQQKHTSQHLYKSSIVLRVPLFDISPGLHKHLHCQGISIFSCRVQRTVSTANQASRRDAVESACA